MVKVRVKVRVRVRARVRVRVRARVRVRVRARVRVRFMRDEIVTKRRLIGTDRYLSFPPRFDSLGCLATQH